MGPTHDGLRLSWMDGHPGAVESQAQRERGEIDRRATTSQEESGYIERTADIQRLRLNRINPAYE